MSQLEILLWLTVYVYQSLRRLKSYRIRTAADSIPLEKNKSGLNSIAVEQQQTEFHRSRTTTD